MDITRRGQVTVSIVRTADLKGRTRSAVAAQDDSYPPAALRMEFLVEADALDDAIPERASQPLERIRRAAASRERIRRSTLEQAPANEACHVKLYLSDTHALVWFATGKTSKLGTRARRLFEATRTGAATIAVSVVSLWEVALLCESDVLRLPAGFSAWCDALEGMPGFRIEPLVRADIEEARGLPLLRDPQEADRRDGIAARCTAVVRGRADHGFEARERYLVRAQPEQDIDRWAERRAWYASPGCGFSSGAAMDLDDLNVRVTGAILRAERVPAGSTEAEEAFREVGRLEESIASITPPEELEGEIARLGAVTAALSAADPTPRAVAHGALSCGKDLS